MKICSVKSTIDNTFVIQDSYNKDHPLPYQIAFQEILSKIYSDFDLKLHEFLIRAFKCYVRGLVLFKPQKDTLEIDNIQNYLKNY